jgi:formylglycine-generating enzyme required for sulfatase activity
MLPTASRILASCLCSVLVGPFLGAAAVSAEPGGASSEARDLAFWEELAFWDSIKNSKSPDEYRAYLNAYPNGRFAALARVRMEALSGKSQQSSATSRTERPESTSTPGSRAAELPRRKPAGAEPPAAAGGQARKLLRDCSDCPQLVVIPPGRFHMGYANGRPDEKPVHEVVIPRAFAIGAYEITAGEWDVCVREGGCKFNPSTQESPRIPISNISLDDALQYVRWLSGKTGKKYRLPSEAEWEYAARAGTTTNFWWGNEVKPGMANCADCRNPGDGKGKTPVGSFKPNRFGLYDMLGNVWEWAGDCWNASYKGAPANGEAWVRGDCLSGALRGGTWNLDHDYMRASRRLRYDRDVRYYLNGFRVARPVD